MAKSVWISDLFRSIRKPSVFTGHLYVTLDSTYFVQKAILNVPKDINLNFVSRMTIEQIFERTSDSTRIIKKDDISVNFKLSEKKLNGNVCKAFECL